MKQKKKNEGVDFASDMANFTNDLIKALNAEHGDGDKVAYNLERDESPTNIKRWISTGCKQLDYLISNSRGGGIPEGRITELFGPPGNGKSHVAIQVAKSTQELGGLVVYIDSENATSIENLKLLGVDISKNFIYADAVCTEKVFALCESIIVKTRSLKKDVPVTIIWDSVAATSPKAEILGDYDKDSIGLQARALSKGFRKITQVIGSNKVTFLVLNQTRTAIGQMFGDNQVPPGGKAIPFHASVRIKLGAGSHITDAKTGDVIGINVNAKTIKNKTAAPFRKCAFQIHFGVGIKEHEELFDFLRPLGPAEVTVNEKKCSVSVEGTSAWKLLLVVVDGKKIIEKKFTKNQFGNLIKDPQYAAYIDALIDAHMTKKLGSVDEIDIDHDAFVEVSAVAEMLTDEMLDEAIDA